MSTGVWIAIFVVVVIGAVVQGSVGFGLNLIVVPVVVQFDADFVPGPILMLSMGFSLLVFVRDRTAIAVRPVVDALVGRLLGTLVGVLVLRELTDDGIVLVVGIAVLAMVVTTAFVGPPGRTRKNMLTAGAVSGTTATTAGIGGPPVALMFQSSPGPEIRSSMAGYFFAGSILTLAILTAAGEFGADEIGLGARMLPGALVGFLLSGPLLPVIDRGYTRPAILALSAAAALALLVRFAL